MPPGPALPVIPSLNDENPPVALFEANSEFLSEHLQPLAEARDIAGELVVEDQRRDRRREAHGGSEQRFRDAGRHDCKVGFALGRDVAEGVHDADNGAEQADEGRGRGDDRQRGQALFHLHGFPDRGDGHL